MSMSHKILSMNSLINTLKTNISFRTLTTSSALMKAEDRKLMLASLPARDEGTAGEKTMMIDSLISRKVNIFPDGNTSKTLFNGQIFSEIPVISVKVTKNNTILTFADAQGVPQIIRSCGVEGFKNTRKGTNIAAQTTASTLSTKVIERGIKNVRVTVRGLGPGRLVILFLLKSIGSLKLNLILIVGVEGHLIERIECGVGNRYDSRIVESTKTKEGTETVNLIEQEEML